MNSPDSLVGLARAASERGDWPELRRLAETLRTKFPGHPEGYLLGKASLLKLGQPDAADTLLSQAARLFPDDRQVFFESAWLAHERKDWMEARRRWDTVGQRFPDHPISYIGRGMAARESGYFDEADGYLSGAIARFPDNSAALIEHAWVAHQRGDFAEARRRWKHLRDRFPENQFGYLGAGVTEEKAGDLAAADAVLADGHARFPSDVSIGINHGWIATLRRDWLVAVERWRSLRRSFPDNETIAENLIVAMSNLTRQNGSDPARVDASPVDVPAAASDAEIIQQGVLIGRDELLFLADGGHAVLDFAAGRRQVPLESYDNFLRNILHRYRAASSNGARFQHVIFPDKHSVCTESFPIRNPVLLGELYLERLPAISHHICYPRDVLRQANHPPFLRTDTHLTDHGTILACGEIVARLVGEPQTAHVNRLLAETTAVAELEGDLGGKLIPPRRERIFKSPMKWVRNWYHNNLTGGQNGIIDILFNEQGVHGKRILWFGDSFGRSACQFMAYFFKEVVFFRTPFFHIELFQQIHPDYLITQNVERYLNYVHSDAVRPAFFMYPYLNGQPYQPGADFAAAMSAVLSHGRKPYDDFLAKIGMEHNNHEIA